MALWLTSWEFALTFLAAYALMFLKPLFLSGSLLRLHSGLGIFPRKVNRRPTLRLMLWNSEVNWVPPCFPSLLFLLEAFSTEAEHPRLAPKGPMSPS